MVMNMIPMGTDGTPDFSQIQDSDVAAIAEQLESAAKAMFGGHDGEHREGEEHRDSDPLDGIMQVFNSLKDMDP